MNACALRWTYASKMSRTALWFSVVLLSLSAVITEFASAEMYIAGQVGYAAPSELSDIKGTGSSAGTTSTDLALKSSLAYGIKVGGYFPGAANWLGLEFDGFYSQPSIKAQTATLTPGGPQQVTATRFGVAHFVGNVVVRYPGETFQPYAGIGGGVNVAGLQNTASFSDEVTMAPCLNLLAGMRVFVTERIALFGEFKHNRSTFKFSDNEFDGKYRENFFMGGIAFHFK